MNNAVNIEERKQISKVFTHVNSFCINTYLCDFFNVKYNEKPNKHDIFHLKHVMTKEYYINNAKFSHYFHLLTIENNHLIFSRCHLVINKKGHIRLYGSKIFDTKKEINHILSNQFIYNGKIIKTDTFNIHQPLNFKDFKIIFAKDLLKHNISHF